ncbi:hypothetical protein PSPO01_15279 [Paraphaeosphaeria sporulosa]
MSREDLGEARKLKYRMSCDVCHAAKIKCGSVKPPCRRCSIKHLECVFSISHRKGRPREKRKTTETGIAPDDPMSEPMQLSDLLTLPTIGPEAPVTAAPSDSSGLLSAADSLSDDLTFNSFGLEENFDFPIMFSPMNNPALLNESETSTTLQRGISQDKSEPRLGLRSDHVSQPRSISTLANVTAINQAFSDDFNFLGSDLFDTSYEPQEERGYQNRNPPYRSSSDEFLLFGGDGAQQAMCRINCDCFPDLLRRIRSLNSQHKSRESIPIGSLLMMEQETNESLCRLQRCKSCGHDTIAYLFAMASVRIVLNLMQKTVHDEFRTRRVEASRSSGTCDSSRFDEQSPEGARSRDQRDSNNLYIGNFAVAVRVRRRFLREILQGRFSKFLTYVEEREKVVNGFGKDCFTEGASAMMQSIARDLKTMLGWMELWSLRD